MEALMLLEEIVSNLERIANVFEYLFVENAPEGVPDLLFSRRTVQQTEHWETYAELLNKALARANYSPTLLSNDTVNLFYENLSKLKPAIEEMTEKLDSYIAQSEKDRGYLSFLRAFRR